MDLIWISFGSILLSRDLALQERVVERVVEAESILIQKTIQTITIVLILIRNNLSAIYTKLGHMDVECIQAPMH